jgi:hypothetical protein
MTVDSRPTVFRPYRPFLAKAQLSVLGHLHRSSDTPGPGSVDSSFTAARKAALTSAPGQPGSSKVPPVNLGRHRLRSGATPESQQAPAAHHLHGHQYCDQFDVRGRKS